MKSECPASFDLVQSISIASAPSHGDTARVVVRYSLLGRVASNGAVLAFTSLAGPDHQLPVSIDTVDVIGDPTSPTGTRVSDGSSIFRLFRAAAERLLDLPNEVRGRIEDAESSLPTDPRPHFDLIAPTGIRPPLATALSDTLERRGCGIPHSVESGSGIAFRGNFLGEGADDWAVWCILPAQSVILVFRQGGGPTSMFKVDVAAPPEPGRRWYPDAPAGTTARCVGSISLVPAAKLSDLVRAGEVSDGSKLTDAERAIPAHDGIGDGDCEASELLHYWTGRRWVTFSVSD